MGFEETLQLPLKVISPLKVQGTFSLKKNTPCTGGVGDKNLQDTCLSCLMSTLYVEKGDRDHAKKTEALQWCVCAVVVEKSTTPPLPLISHTSPRVVQYCQQYSIGKNRSFIWPLRSIWRIQIFWTIQNVELLSDILLATLKNTSRYSGTQVEVCLFDRFVLFDE